MCAVESRTIVEGYSAIAPKMIKTITNTYNVQADCECYTCQSESERKEKQ